MSERKMCSGSCLANDWARDPRRAGFKRNINLEVGGDGQSVIIVATHEDGRRMRMNFSSGDARRLLADLQAAATIPAPGFDPYGVMKS
ncbi:MAG: hypothetical protein IT435_05480 [Phycisphaerales bacterium]|nr:hypothetical protein [Phycisphaerales bacterium]